MHLRLVGILKSHVNSWDAGYLCFREVYTLKSFCLLLQNLLGVREIEQCITKCLSDSTELSEGFLCLKVSHSVLIFAPIYMYERRQGRKAVSTPQFNCAARDTARALAETIRPETSITNDGRMC